MLQLPSHHGVQIGLQVRGALGALALTSSGVGLCVLSAAGEIHPASALAGLLFGGLGLWLGRSVLQDRKRRLIVDAQGLLWVDTHEQVRLDWGQIRSADLTERNGEVRAITLRGDSQQITVAEDRQDWEQLRADLLSRLGR